MNPVSQLTGREEEVLRIIGSSPEALEAFNSWMKLQWATFIAELSLASFVTLVVFVGVGYLIYKLYKE